MDRNTRVTGSKTKRAERARMHGPAKTDTKETGVTTRETEKA